MQSHIRPIVNGFCVGMTCKVHLDSVSQHCSGTFGAEQATLMMLVSSKSVGHAHLIHVKSSCSCKDQWIWWRSKLFLPSTCKSSPAIVMPRICTIFAFLMLLQCRTDNWFSSVSWCTTTSETWTCAGQDIGRQQNACIGIHSIWNRGASHLAFSINALPVAATCVRAGWSLSKTRDICVLHVILWQSICWPVFKPVTSVKLKICMLATFCHDALGRMGKQFEIAMVSCGVTGWPPTPCNVNWPCISSASQIICENFACELCCLCQQCLFLKCHHCCCQWQQSSHWNCMFIGMTVSTCSVALHLMFHLTSGAAATCQKMHEWSWTSNGWEWLEWNWCHRKSTDSQWLQLVEEWHKHKCKWKQEKAAPVIVVIWNFQKLASQMCGNNGGLEMLWRACHHWEAQRQKIWHTLMMFPLHKKKPTVSFGSIRTRKNFFTSCTAILSMLQLVLLIELNGAMESSKRLQFQLLMQCGTWQLMNLVMEPGTPKRSVWLWQQKSKSSKKQLRSEQILALQDGSNDIIIAMVMVVIVCHQLEESAKLLFGSQWVWVQMANNLIAWKHEFLHCDSFSVDFALGLCMCAACVQHVCMMCTFTATGITFLQIACKSDRPLWRVLDGGRTEQRVEPESHNGESVAQNDAANDDADEEKRTLPQSEIFYMIWIVKLDLSQRKDIFHQSRWMTFGGSSDIRRDHLTLHFPTEPYVDIRMLVLLIFRTLCTCTRVTIIEIHTLCHSHINFCSKWLSSAFSAVIARATFRRFFHIEGYTMWQASTISKQPQSTFEMTFWKLSRGH